MSRNRPPTYSTHQPSPVITGDGQPCSSFHQSSDESSSYPPRPTQPHCWRRRRRRPRRRTRCCVVRHYLAIAAATAAVTLLCGIGDETTGITAALAAAASSDVGCVGGVWPRKHPFSPRLRSPLRHGPPCENEDDRWGKRAGRREGPDPHPPPSRQPRRSSERGGDDDAAVVVGAAANCVSGGRGGGIMVTTTLPRLRGGGDDDARDDANDDDGDDDCSEQSSTSSETAGGIGASTAVTATTSDAKRSYQVSRFAMRGARPYMEDEHFVSTPGGEFAAVFDGHGGSAVSRYLRRNLFANLLAELDRRAPPGRRELQTSGAGAPPRRRSSSSAAAASAAPPPPSVRDCVDALRAAFAKVDGEVQRVSHWSFQGSTAVAVLLHEEAGGEEGTGGLLHDEETDEEEGEGRDDKRNRNHRQHRHRTTATTTILSANVGDSRAVLSRDGLAIDLTVDHKPNLASERVRIEALGGTVEWYGLTEQNGSGGEGVSGGSRPVEGSGVYRINGNLAVSRAVGDRSERPHVNAEVDVGTTRLIPPRDEFVVLASDGLWDVVSSQEAVSFVREELGLTAGCSSSRGRGGVTHSRRKRDGIAKSLAREAIRRGSLDNVTVLIVWLLD